MSNQEVGTLGRIEYLFYAVLAVQCIDGFHRLVTAGDIAAAQVQAGFWLVSAVFFYLFLQELKGGRRQLARRLMYCGFGCVTCVGLVGFAVSAGYF